MSMYAQFDEDGAQEQIAAGSGWSRFGDWADGLDAATYPGVVQLWEHGHSTTVSDVERELATALETHAPADEETRSVAQALLDAIRQNPAAEIVIITNGARTDDGLEDEAQEGAGEDEDEEVPA